MKIQSKSAFTALSILALTGLIMANPSFAAEATTPTEQPAGGTQTELKDDDEAKPDNATVEAEKPAENPGRYAPDDCDFEVTFPEKPYLAQKCMPDGKTCYNLYSYTMVYDLHTTVDVSVTCNKSTPADFKRYNEAVMKAALMGMIEERRLDSHEIQFKQDKETHSASLTGTGTTGAQPKIYTAQIWVGQHSVFTVQAELIGGEHKDADKTFTEILKSIKIKAKEEEPKKSTPKAP